MNRVCSIFAQILQLIPRPQFEKAVRETKAERHARGFTCWGQMVAMMFCQLAGARSLREICQGLAASEGKLKHLGIPLAPSRSTLAYANEHRPWKLYEMVFAEVLQRCYSAAAGRKKKFRFKNKLLSLDSTSIDLCASIFDWAQYKRTKGAVKIHLLLDHEGYLPCFAHITDGKTHDVTVGRGLRFQPGTVVVFDKGYVDYSWWKQMIDDDVFFVTRLKRDLKFKVVKKREVPKGSNVRADQDICIAPEGKDFVLELRMVTIWDDEKKEEITFLTNQMKFAPRTIAAIYKDRWQIELFFKALKQLLRIKTFVGTSPNALKIQVWTALIAIVLLKYLHLHAMEGWSLSNLVALVRQQLFVYRDLYEWLKAPLQAPPVLAGLHDGQLQLGF